MKKIVQMSMLFVAVVGGTVSSVVATVDTIDPVITLIGNKVIHLAVGSTYSDPGATATDDQDPVVPVSRSGSFNTKKAGTYELHYTAADGAGNVSGVDRTIIVGSGKSGSVLGASTFHFTQTLRLNSRGTQVRELQKFLKVKGYSRGMAIDGRFGSEARDAVITMQQANGLVPADGVVDAKTRAVLNK